METILNFRYARLVFGLILVLGFSPTTSHAINDSVIRPTNTTADRIVATDSTKKIVSVDDLTPWVAGTTNRVSVADDGDGTITLSAPQDTDTDADMILDSVSLDYIDFNLTATDAMQEGRVRWNQDEGTINVGMPGGSVVGQLFQELYIPKRCKNTTGITMPNGTVVYLSGGTGGFFEIALADASTEVLSAATIGVTTEDIDHNQFGYVVPYGDVRGDATEPIDTSGMTVNDNVWLSEVAGEWTDTKPATPAHAVLVGKVLVVHATDGEIFVNIQNGWETYELHDVDDSIPTVDGQNWTWDVASDYYKLRTSRLYGDDKWSFQPGADSTTTWQLKDQAGNTDVNYDSTNNVFTLSGDLLLSGLTASRLTASDASKNMSSVATLTSWVAGTANQITVTDDGDGSITLSTPQDIHSGASPTFVTETLTGLIASMPVWTDASKALVSKAINVDINYPISMYDAEPARGSETNWHGGLLGLATGQPLDSVPTDVVVTKGIGKILIVVNAGSDLAGDITITGTTVDRETGATTPADTDTITIDALTTDGTTTDSNGNTVHAFTGAYIGAKWFYGTVTLSTANLTLTDVDAYHVSFEQNNDNDNMTLNTFDANLFTTNVNAEFDAYLFGIRVTDDKCDLVLGSELHVGADGMTAIANKYERLRRGNINEPFDGTTDGWWVDVHYSNSPAYVEDVTITVWATKAQVAY